MTRVLAYCAFLEREGIRVPQFGVEKSPVQTLAAERLRLLWSVVPWPFDPAHLQQNAVEFHDVVHQVFKQAAVVPFRLLSTFEDRELLERFVAQHRASFISDLERLSPFVQMESVIYTIGKPEAAVSGTDYLQSKARRSRAVREHAENLRALLARMSREVRLRENKNGVRLFALLDRGAEQSFREAINGIQIPQGLSRRISGPWPAGEFMSEEVKMPALVTRNE